MAQQTYGQALGALVLRKRKAASLTQMQLAEDAYGTSGKTRRISELENGTVANPYPKTIDPIISVLKISDQELEECARQALAPVDADLDRAYREARNLIDALARQFEHANPDSTLAEIDDFLRAKAREWRSLRERIAAIDAPDSAIDRLKREAAEALSEGEFDKVDVLLVEAEEAYQKDRTLAEVKKYCEIRVTRGHNGLFRGKPDLALTLFLSAAGMLRPIDESEAAKLLNQIAGDVYEYARRSLATEISVAAKLLEALVEMPSMRADAHELAKINYRLGLIYRSDAESARANLRQAALLKAAEHSRNAWNYFQTNGEPFEAVSSATALANCLWQDGNRSASKEQIREAVELLQAAQKLAEASEDTSQLLPHVYNSLGSALMDLSLVDEESPSMDSLSEAQRAFADGIRISEKLSHVEGWGVAKLNLGGLLGFMAMAEDLEPSVRDFLRVRAIAEISSGLETFPSESFPIRYANGQLKLARILRDHALDVAEGLVEFYLFRAMGAFESAGSVFTEERDPATWAGIQLEVGSIFAYHAKLADDDVRQQDFQMAIERFEYALPIFLEVNDKIKADWCAGALQRAKSALAEIGST